MISHELNITIEAIPLEISWDGVRIADFRGRWDNMYAKLELSKDKYEQVKQRFLLFSGSETNKDFSDEILSEESRYSYNPSIFHSMLSAVKNTKKIADYYSMNIDEFEELIIMETTYGKMGFLTGATGSRHYVLVKERSGECYLYIIIH